MHIAARICLNYVSCTPPSSFRSRKDHIHLPRVTPLVGCRSKTHSSTDSWCARQRRFSITNGLCKTDTCSSKKTGGGNCLPPVFKNCWWSDEFTSFRSISDVQFCSSVTSGTWSATGAWADMRPSISPCLVRAVFLLELNRMLQTCNLHYPGERSIVHPKENMFAPDADDWFILLVLSIMLYWI
jgi:hypothetical protein